MAETLLPNYSKKIALTLGVISLIVLIINFSVGKIEPIEPNLVAYICKIIFLVSLLILVFSKEKRETKQINVLRLQQLRSAVGFGVVVIVLDSISEIIFWDGHIEMKSGYTILILIHLYYLFFFTFQKYKYNKTIL